MNRDTKWFFNWYWQKATSDEKKLVDRVSELENMFDDMLFQQGSCTYELLACQSKAEDGEWIDDEFQLPEEIEEFSYHYFHFKVDPQSEHNGYFDPKKQELCIAIKKIDDDKTIMHEMIHMHEYFLTELSPSYHDAVLWSLYRYLKPKIPKLDEIINEHVNLLDEWTVSSIGGCHDVLFLLKSFDLDIRNGFKLGTVFAYGYAEDYGDYKYLIDQ